jgi:hypothetical protein
MSNSCLFEAEGRRGQELDAWGQRPGTRECFVFELCVTVAMVF